MHIHLGIQRRLATIQESPSLRICQLSAYYSRAVFRIQLARLLLEDRHNPDNHEYLRDLLQRPREADPPWISADRRLTLWITREHTTFLFPDYKQHYPT